MKFDSSKPLYLQLANQFVRAENDDNYILIMTEAIMEIAARVDKIGRKLRIYDEKIPDYDLDKCPNCGGPADNGHDRCIPPSPYFCTKCMEE